MKKKLKLYVWEGVLTDYTDGIMFALAASPDAARRAILISRKLDPKRIKTGFKKGEYRNSIFDEIMQEPAVYSTTTGFALYGGG